MKALVFHGTRDLRFEDAPTPQPGAGEVLIRVHKCSICGSDLGAYKDCTDRWKPPIILGHEFSGEIVELGEGVIELSVGQRVSANPMQPCHKCRYCRRDMENLCPNRRSLGTAIGGVQTHGAMAEYVCVPDWTVLPLAESISYESGALLEPSAVALAAAKCARTNIEMSVVVIGAGPIGLLILKSLKSLGTIKVIVSEPNRQRREKALACGADYVVDPACENAVARVRELCDGYGAARAINAAGAFAIQQSLEMTRSGGTAVLVALGNRRVEIDPMEIVGRGTSLTGSYMFTNEMEEVANMIAKERLVVEDLVTKTYPLSAGVDAFEALCDANNRDVKVQLDCLCQ